MSTPTPTTHGYPQLAEPPVLRPGPDGGVAVIEAVRKVMADLPNIGKDDQAPAGEGRYRYRGIEAITRHVQQLLATHGLVVIPRAEVLATVPSPAMNEGWQDVIMRVEWSLFGLDGSSLTAVTNGVGRDKSDKGANKAQTQAYKYLLLHVLCVADGKDDSDGQSYEDGRNEPGHRDDPKPIERFTAPTGEIIDIWPGEVNVKAAKRELVAAVGGDKDAAGKAWTTAGLDGKWKVQREVLDPLLLLMRGGSSVEAGVPREESPSAAGATAGSSPATAAPAPNEDERNDAMHAANAAYSAEGTSSKPWSDQHPDEPF